jgi:hypothetical protein
MGTRDFCSTLAALVSPVQNTFFPHCTLLQFLCPIAQQAGQAVVLGRLSLSMCLLFCHSWAAVAEKPTNMAGGLVPGYSGPWILLYIYPSSMVVHTLIRLIIYIMSVFLITYSAEQCGLP